MLDVVAAISELIPTEPERTQRGALQHHVGRLDAEAVDRRAEDASTVMRRVRPLPLAGDEGAAEIDVWTDSRLRIHRSAIGLRARAPRAAL